MTMKSHMEREGVGNNSTMTMHCLLKSLGLVWGFFKEEYSFEQKYDLPTSAQVDSRKSEIHYYIILSYEMGSENESYIFNSLGAVL